jgi:hypothetical protein
MVLRIADPFQPTIEAIFRLDERPPAISGTSAESAEG